MIKDNNAVVNCQQQADAVNSHATTCSRRQTCFKCIQKQGVNLHDLIIALRIMFDLFHEHFLLYNGVVEFGVRVAYLELAHE